MRFATRGRTLAALLLAAAVIPGCSDDDTIDAGGGGLTPPSDTLELVSKQDYSVKAATDIQHPDIVSFDVPVPAGGVVRVEADWSSPDNDIDMTVAQNDCRSGIAAWNGDCTVYEADRSSLTKPARADFTLASAATIRVYLYNFSKAPESGVLQVLLRR